MAYLQRSGSEFRLNGSKYRFIGFNYYPAIISYTAQSTIQQLFDAAVAKGSNIFRTWCFDAGEPPSDSGGNFRYLEYPEGTNLVTNDSFETNTTGWTLGTGYSRSTDTAHDGTYAIKSVQTSGYNELISDAIATTQDTDYVYTFWRNVDVNSGAAPVTFIKGVDTGTTIKDGGFSSDTSGAWIKKQILFNSGANDSIQIRHVNWNGNNTAYYDNVNLSLQSTPELTQREETFEQLDMVLDEARQRNVKLILSLADNPTYDTKLTYVQWANAINDAGLSTSFPYIGFFTSEYCKDMYKAFIAMLATRVNSINGRLYSEDDSIASIELGNELRLDRNDPNGINSLDSDNLALLSNEDGWIDEMSTYAKTQFPNHLIGFSSMAHTWQWVDGDTVSNGTYYGVDYNIISALPNIDYLDFHCYPTQAGDGTPLMKFGQRLGFPNAVTGAGFRAQLQDYIKVGHANNKPVICGEIGFPREVQASTTHYPLYPRHTAFKNIFKDFFDAGGDGMLLWSATVTGGGSYSVGLADSGGEETNDNTNDTKLMSLVAQRNALGRGRRIPVDAVKGISL